MKKIWRKCYCKGPMTARTKGNKKNGENKKKTNGTLIFSSNQAYGAKDGASYVVHSWKTR